LMPIAFHADDARHFAATRMFIFLTLR